MRLAFLALVKICNRFSPRMLANENAHVDGPHIIKIISLDKLISVMDKLFSGKNQQPKIDN